MAAQDLIPEVTTYVRAYMANYDPSHDFNHIRRVVRLAQQLHAAESKSFAVPLDPAVVQLAALLHDVGDRKYLREGDDPATMVQNVLLGFGASQELAERVQAICLGVSYSSEVKDPARVRELIGVYPELAIVQDADRLDAIGAVGIGRCFAFGGAKDRPMEETIRHFDDKLILIEGMMKTATGKEMARERTERLLTFKSWWEAEHTALGDDE
ncbi:related to HD superfamily hydrolase [Cephalotrichum gorgonifer]|uniref:Related to HD superfamily hydrolase n=1 Tax=Cephalotrichum gorgonifer TaxID=2041049 RepID=A0AAE8SR27_9PEZI|nr:related to HD superfamily hydrolase [Cephalotrichum gorgonifer]